MPRNPETSSGEPFTVEEIDDEDLPAPVIDLAEEKKRREYEEFWSDPCWTEPFPSPNGG